MLPTLPNQTKVSIQLPPTSNQQKTKTLPKTPVKPPPLHRCFESAVRSSTDPVKGGCFLKTPSQVLTEKSCLEIHKDP